MLGASVPRARCVDSLQTESRLRIGLLCTDVDPDFVCTPFTAKIFYSKLDQDDVPSLVVSSVQGASHFMGRIVERNLMRPAQPPIWDAPIGIESRHQFC